MARRHHTGESAYTVAGVVPKTSAAAAVTTGAAVDRTAIAKGGVFLSGRLHVDCGAATGSPTAQSVIGTLTHCATSGGTYVALTDKDGTAITTAAIIADDSGASVNFDLGKAFQYLKAVVTVALTAGSTPTIPIAATLVLGGGDIRPVA